MGLRDKSFLARFWTLFDDERTKHLIGWSENGKYFYIYDITRNREHLTRAAIERGILQRAGHGKGQAMRKTPKYDNISRQLRYYGWNRRQDLDRGLQIAWSHPHLHRESSLAKVRDWKSNAPSKSKQHNTSKKHTGGGHQEREEVEKEYFNRSGSVDQCPRTPTSPKCTKSTKSISVKSEVGEQAKKSIITVYGASMVTFRRPTELYDLEQSGDTIRGGETISLDQRSILRQGTQTPSPTLAPPVNWKTFDLGIGKDMTEEKAGRADSDIQCVHID